jgi:type IV pilus assembly protein PilW
MMPKLLRTRRGFTLIELLIVLVIFGLAMTAIYGVHQSTQRSTYTQENVVELQQNLRIGLESISRDLRWAGFMIPNTQDAIGVANTNDITINTISATKRVARITSDFDSPSSITTEKVISLDAALDITDGAGNEYVRIIRPASASQPVPRILTLTAGWSSTTLTVKGFNSAEAFLAGDIVAEYSDPDNDEDANPNTFAVPPDVPTAETVDDPNTISYLLDVNQLKRNNLSGANQVVADDITALTFGYLLEDGTEAASVASDLGDIRAVRVTLTGQVTTAEGTKQRSMTSVVSLRNR